MCIYKEKEEGRGIGGKRRKKNALDLFTFILKYNVEMSKKLTSSPANGHLSLSVSLSLSQTHTHTHTNTLKHSFIHTHTHTHTYETLEDQVSK